MRTHKPTTTTTTPMTFIMKYSWTVYILCCIYEIYVYSARTHRKLRHFDHFHRSSLSIHSMSDANTTAIYYVVVRFCPSQSPISFGYLSQVLHNMSESPYARALTCITMKTIFNGTSITDSTMTEHSLISLSLRSQSCIVR